MVEHGGTWGGRFCASWDRPQRRYLMGWVLEKKKAELDRSGGQKPVAKSKVPAGSHRILACFLGKVFEMEDRGRLSGPLVM